MASITIPRGDEGFKLEFTITDSSDVAINLTTYTAVTLKMWAMGAPVTLILDEACANALADGTCDYTVAVADFAGGVYPPAGSYRAEIEMTGTGIKESTENFTVIIEESG